MASNSEEGTLPGLGWILAKSSVSMKLCRPSHICLIWDGMIFSQETIHYLLILTILDFTSFILIISATDEFVLAEAEYGSILQLLSQLM